MVAIPDDWIDRLFRCMNEFYGERWSKDLESEFHTDIYKTIWKSGLYGLNYDQIKSTLYYYRKESRKKHSLPPLVTEFYHHASDVHPSAQMALSNA